MSLDIQIRRATVDDVPAVVNLAEKLARKEDDETQGSTAGFLVSAYDEDTYRHLVDHADQFYVAYTRERPRLAGFVLAYSEVQIGREEQLNKRLRRTIGEFIVIKQVGVAPAFGRQGVASRMYAHMRAVLPAAGRTQLVAAVVDDPPNEVSASFHRKQGFSPLTEMDAPDGKRRVIWRYSTLPVDSELLHQQYERAIQLYLHEDLLNWEKLRNYMYITVALGAAVGFMLEPVLAETGAAGWTPRASLCMALCLVGVLTSIGYSIALRSGIRYLAGHKERVSVLEDSYVRQDGIRLVSHLYGTERWRKRAPTSSMLQYSPVVGLILWLATAAMIALLFRG